MAGCNECGCDPERPDLQAEIERLRCVTMQQADELARLTSENEGQRQHRDAVRVRLQQRVEELAMENERLRVVIGSALAMLQRATP